MEPYRCNNSLNTERKKEKRKGFLCKKKEQPTVQNKGAFDNSRALGKVTTGSKEGQVYFDLMVTEFSIYCSDLTVVLASPSYENRKLLLLHAECCKDGRKCGDFCLCSAL